MAIPKQFERYLSKFEVPHDVISHKKIFTAFDLAQTTGKKLSEIAKTVAVKADTRYALVVIPASHRVDMTKLKKTLKAKKVAMVKEVHLAKVLKVKPGSITPFATFYNIPVYIDKNLLKSRVILVSTGSFTDSLKIKTKVLIDRGAESLTSVSKKHFSDVKSKPKAKAKKKKVTIKKRVVAKKAVKKKVVKRKK